eukprot:Rhum_TRINITY_DN20797_c0_g1::Rhum_TRINITY_DN20797_c0_g1_i1::g.172173::m.172173
MDMLLNLTWLCCRTTQIAALIYALVFTAACTCLLTCTAWMTLRIAVVEAGGVLFPRLLAPFLVQGPWSEQEDEESQTQGLEASVDGGCCLFSPEDAAGQVPSVPALLSSPPQEAYPPFGVSLFSGSECSTPADSAAFVAFDTASVGSSGDDDEAAPFLPRPIYSEEWALPSPQLCFADVSEKQVCDDDFVWIDGDDLY